MLTEIIPGSLAVPLIFIIKFILFIAFPMGTLAKEIRGLTDLSGAKVVQLKDDIKREFERHYKQKDDHFNSLINGRMSDLRQTVLSLYQDRHEFKVKMDFIENKIDEMSINFEAFKTGTVKDIRDASQNGQLLETCATMTQEIESLKESLLGMQATTSYQDELLEDYANALQAEASKQAKLFSDHEIVMQAEASKQAILFEDYKNTMQAAALKQDKLFQDCKIAMQAEALKQANLFNDHEIIMQVEASKQAKLLEDYEDSMQSTVTKQIKLVEDHKVVMQAEASKQVDLLRHYKNAMQVEDSKQSKWVQDYKEVMQKVLDVQVKTDFLHAKMAELDKKIDDISTKNTTTTDEYSNTIDALEMKLCEMIDQLENNTPLDNQKVIQLLLQQAVNAEATLAVHSDDIKQLHFKLINCSKTVDETEIRHYESKDEELHLKVEFLKTDIKLANQVIDQLHTISHEQYCSLSSIVKKVNEHSEHLVEMAGIVDDVVNCYSQLVHSIDKEESPKKEDFVVKKCPDVKVISISKSSELANLTFC